MSQRKKQGALTPPLNESASTSTSISSTPPRRELLIVAPKRLGRGKRISSLSKMIVEKMRQHFEKEREKGGPITMFFVVERTAIATGLAVRTMSIHKEFTSCDDHLLTPIKKYMLSPESGSTLTRLIARAVIRRVVHWFYLRKECPTPPEYWGRSRKLVPFQMASSAYGGVFFGRWILRTLNDLFTNGSM